MLKLIVGELYVGGDDFEDDNLGGTDNYDNEKHINSRNAESDDDWDKAANNHGDWFSMPQNYSGWCNAAIAFLA